MRPVPLLVVVLLFPLVRPVPAQQALARQLRTLQTESGGQLRIACALPGTPLACALDPFAHPPMQSVFKLPLALAVLHQVEQGTLSLDQPVRFLPEDRILPETFSPLQDRYPQAGVEVPLRILLELSVTVSDNTASDLLLRVAGGPAGVTAIITSFGITGFHLEDSEHVLHRDPAAQYRNWFEPAGAVALLRRLNDASPLTPEHTALLLGWMRFPPRFRRLQGDLPAGTGFAHKTGTSGEVGGIAPATNDIALISLPDGRQLALAVFLTDSTANAASRDAVIARVGRAVYDDAVRAR